MPYWFKQLIILLIAGCMFMLAGTIPSGFLAAHETWYEPNRQPMFWMSCLMALAVLALYSWLAVTLHGDRSDVS